MTRADRVALFMPVYTEALAAAVEDHPDEYGGPWSPERLGETLLRMEQAFLRGTYNIDSRAIRGACKAFGIRYSRQGMEEWFNGE